MTDATANTADELIIDKGRPSLLGFTVPLTAAMGGLFGFLTGNTVDQGLIGFVLGLIYGGAAGFILMSFVANRTAGRWALIILTAALGFYLGKWGGAAGGAIVGAVVSWWAYWIGRGDYRDGVPTYATPGQTLWHVTYLFICGFVFFFLIAPILTIIPLSFNSENFFTFTPEMLGLSPEGYSLKHYEDFFTNSNWQSAMWNSLKIAPMATLLAVGFGTLAAIGLSQPHVPFRRAIMAVLISPMIVPLIISAAGMYFFYSRVNLQGTYLGVVLAHAALGIPFVIITVTATLVGFDRSLTRAAANLGADPVTTFLRIQMPLILPGVISGGLFAFITSFDEVVVVLFVGSAQQKTLPWQMFIGLREQISPTILAVATILVTLSIALLATIEILRRRSERMRGLSPQ